MFLRSVEINDYFKKLRKEVSQISWQIRLNLFAITLVSWAIFLSSIILFILFIDNVIEISNSYKPYHVLVPHHGFSTMIFLAGVIILLLINVMLECFKYMIAWNAISKIPINFKTISIHIFKRLPKVILMLSPVGILKLYGNCLIYVVFLLVLMAIFYFLHSIGIISTALIFLIGLMGVLAIGLLIGMSYRFRFHRIARIGILFILIKNVSAFEATSMSMKMYREYFAYYSRLNYPVSGGVIERAILFRDSFERVHIV